jgi:hypothetical protein
MVSSRETSAGHSDMNAVRIIATSRVFRSVGNIPRGGDTLRISGVA